MKIAYLSSFYPLRGGIAQFNAALLNVFKREHEIQAFTFSRQYPNILFPGKSQYVEAGDSAEVIDSLQVLDTINPFSYYSTAKKIIKYKPDFMVTKYWMPFFGPSLGTVAKRLKKHNIKNIAILDNVIPHEKRPGDIALTKYFLKQIHGFIVMSDTVKKDLLSLKPNAIFETQIHPLYNHFGSKISRAEACKNLNIPSNKKNLLFFGFIRDYKGLDKILETMPLLPDEYILIIAGESYGSFDKYDSLIKENNLSDRVFKFVRYISDNEVPLFFSASDVCVLPYKSATQSGIVGISYHFDLPVIATRTGSLAEMIEPYNSGLLIQESMPELLKYAILQYFDNNLQPEMEKNISKYKSEATWEKLAEKILKMVIAFG